MVRGENRSTVGVTYVDVRLGLAVFHHASEEAHLRLVETTAGGRHGGAVLVVEMSSLFETM